MIGLEGLGLGPEVEFTLQQKTSKFFRIRTIKRIRIPDLHFGFARVLWMNSARLLIALDRLLIRFPLLCSGSRLDLGSGSGSVSGLGSGSGSGLSQGFSQGHHHQNLSQVPRARLWCDHRGPLHEVESIEMGCYTDVWMGDCWLGESFGHILPEP